MSFVVMKWRASGTSTAPVTAPSVVHIKASTHCPVDLVASMQPSANYARRHAWAWAMRSACACAQSTSGSAAFNSWTAGAVNE